MDGFSIHFLPPKFSELNGDISVGLMDDEAQVDTLSLANDTSAVRLNPAQNVAGAEDCRQLISHNISGSQLRVRVGDRVCFQNQYGDIGFLTIKERHPEGQFALRVDLLTWQQSS